MNRTGKWILLMMAIAGLGILTGCGMTTVDLNEYMSITSYGYDTMGRASYEFDYDQFEQDYSGKIKINEKNARTLIDPSLLGEEMPADLMLYYCVDQYIENASNLSNGDVVTLKWDCSDQKAEDYFNVKLKYSDMEYEVQGLEEVPTFNPFDYITVSYTGVAPNGKVEISIDNSQTGMWGLVFEANKEDGLRNGDEIVITATMNDSYTMEDYAAQYGMIPNQTEKTYTVDSLPRYIRDLGEIPEDMYNKMDQQLQDSFHAHVASTFDEKERIDGFERIGNYLITLKDDMTGSTDNYLYYIYKVTYSTDELKDFTYYWYGYYTDIMILADGTCTVDISDYTDSDASHIWGVQRGDYLKTDSDHHVYGFADLDSLFNQHVVSKIEKYDYQQTVTE